MARSKIKVPVGDLGELEVDASVHVDLDEAVPAQPDALKGAVVVELRAAVTKLPDRSPQLTAARAFLARSRDPIVSAFLHSEQLRGKTRKMSRELWLVELDTFTKAPR